MPWDQRQKQFGHQQWYLVQTQAGGSDTMPTNQYPQFLREEATIADARKKIRERDTSTSSNTQHHAPGSSSTSWNEPWRHRDWQDEQNRSQWHEEPWEQQEHSPWKRQKWEKIFSICNISEANPAKLLRGAISVHRLLQEAIPCLRISKYCRERSSAIPNAFPLTRLFLF